MTVGESDSTGEVVAALTDVPEVAAPEVVESVDSVVLTKVAMEAVVLLLAGCFHT